MKTGLKVRGGKGVGIKYLVAFWPTFAKNKQVICIKMIFRPKVDIKKRSKVKNPKQFLQQSWMSICNETSCGIAGAELCWPRLSRTRALHSSGVASMFRSGSMPRSGSGFSISGSIWISTIGSTNVHNLILQLADYSAVCCAQHSGVGGYVRHWHGLYLAIEGISGRGLIERAEFYFCYNQSLLLL